MTAFHTLRHTEHIILDLDGTVWTWSGLIPKVKETIERLKTKKIKITYVTNNTIHSAEGMARKLTALGIPTKPKEIITSSESSAAFLQNRNITSVYALGERPLLKTLENHHITSSKKAKAVLVSTDRNITFWKISTAIDLISRNIPFYATGNGPFWQIGSTKYLSDGGIIAAIERATEKTPEVLGKPSKAMIEVIQNRWNIEPEKTAVIGDSFSDVELANRMNCLACLVLTGTAKKDELKLKPRDQLPQIVFSRFDKLLLKL